MTFDPFWLWVIGGVVAGLLLVAMLARTVRKSRSAKLQDRFGVEYDIAVKRVGNRKAAERELVERSHEVDRLDVRDLSAEERQRYRGEWNRIEMRFLERPTTAVAEADELLGEVLRKEGFASDFDQRAAQFAAKKPLLGQHYRAGREISRRGGEASTEDLRQAMLHYRAVFDDLVGMRDDIVTNVPVTSEIPGGRQTPSSVVTEERRGRLSSTD